jgi:anaerobic magnesium-protoporphyrin IX monomethyl ester cyclase
VTGGPVGAAADITLANVGVSNPRTLPVGPLYVAAVLDRAGYRVDFRDCTASSYWELDPGALAASLDDSAPVLGVGCISDTLPFVVAALADFKTRHPGATVILGGPGPTGVARGLVEAFPFIDVVVAGEGEDTMLETMRRLAGGNGGGGGAGAASLAVLADVRGVSYRADGEVRTNPARERIRDLDRLPLPLYDAVDLEKYPMVNIVSSRGCPYNCTFCDVAPMWSRKNFRRSVESVVDEIKYLRTRFGRRYFEFTDETFILSRDRVLEFCARLKREALDIKWSATGRVNLVTRDLLSEMASAGCEAMFFGIESGSDRVLERVRKDFTIGEAVEVLHTTREYMRPVASFIWGFPFETEEDLVRTLLLAVYLSQVGVDSRLSRLAPFPLMPLYQEYGDRLAWFEEPGPYSGREPFRPAGYPAAVRDLVTRYPRIFPFFHCFASDGLEEKARIVRSLGRYWHVAEWFDANGEDGR